MHLYLECHVISRYVYWPQTKACKYFILCNLSHEYWLIYLIWWTVTNKSSEKKQRSPDMKLCFHLFSIGRSKLYYLYSEFLKISTCPYRCCPRWSSGSAFACRSRGPWFKSYTGRTWIFQDTRNESPRLYSTKVWIGTLRELCLCKLDIPGRRML